MCQVDCFWEPPSHSYPVWGIEEFDALIHSPEAEKSRRCGSITRFETMDFMMDGSFDIKKMRDFSSDMSIMTEGLQGVVANIDWVDRTKLSSYLKEAEPLDAYFRSLDRAITNSDKRSPLVMAIARYLSILKCSRDTLSLTNLLTDMAWRVAIAAMRVNTQRAMSIGILKEDETIKQIQTLDL